MFYAFKYSVISARIGHLAEAITRIHFKTIRLDCFKVVK
jgi:hypothetical protein